ncbi:MAG: hypothetical protein D6797_06455 [Bdellovibrio sp.]|nr:MAG: hypothetical protein D6797_06455 [Bdellovibrio sp.]
MFLCSRNCYHLLGLVAASTGQIFGAFMGNPVFIGFLFVVFFLMGLSLLGLFEVQVPSKVSHTLGRYKPSQSFLGAFTSGILSGVVASPCVGPILVSLLAFVSSTRNITLGLSLLFTFALGMGQIFILLGTFSQLLQKLPKSGNWMTGLKWLLGLSLFILAFYFLEPLTSHTLFYLILSASLLTLFLLYLKRPQKWPFLKKKATLLNSLLLILALFSSVYAFLPFWSTNLNTPPDFPHWQPFSEQTILNNKKPIIVDVSADWCAECKELEKTFSAPSIRDIGSQFTWLKFDATKDSPQLQKLKEKYQIRGLPFVMFFNQKGQWLQEQTLTGFESPVEFKKRLERVLQQN